MAWCKACMLSSTAVCQSCHWWHDLVSTQTETKSVRCSSFMALKPFNRCALMRTVPPLQEACLSWSIDKIERGKCRAQNGIQAISLLVISTTVLHPLHLEHCIQILGFTCHRELRVTAPGPWRASCRPPAEDLPGRWTASRWRCSSATARGLDRSVSTKSYEWRYRDTMILAAKIRRYKDIHR